MSPFAALVKKELIEAATDRSSRRGGGVQASMIIVVLGVLLPLAQVKLWTVGVPAAVLGFGFLPGVAAAVLAADAFAGERERRTLATLLATPLPRSTLILAKWASAVIFGMGVAAVALVAAHVTVATQAGMLVLSPKLVLGALAAAGASTATLAALATVVSSRLASARGTQQIATVLGGAFAFGLSQVTRSLGVTATWPAVFLGAGGMLLVALLVLEAGMLLFRTETMTAGD